VRSVRSNQPQKQTTRPRLSVGFILARRFTLCAFANFVDVLRLAADEGDRSRPILCEWSVLSDTMNSVASSCGVQVQPTEKLGDPRKYNYIVVVGGLIDEIPNLSPEYLRYLRRAAALAVPLVGVCTGAFVLHRAGLMDGYRCCVSWFHHADFLERFDGLKPVSDQIFIVDRDRLTCSGGASSAHLAAYLVEKHVGRSQARKSLRIMIIDDPLAAEKPQPGLPLDLTTDDALVKKALLVMQQNIDAPLPAAEIARRLGVSRRQLERHFQHAVGMPPAQAYKTIRFEHADFLLRHTTQSVTEIATSTGFCDSSHFIRAFRALRGTTPAASRGDA
jgi:transcriptional regulator GlxA family with amidase domain